VAGTSMSWSIVAVVVLTSIRRDALGAANWCARGELCGSNKLLTHFDWGQSRICEAHFTSRGSSGSEHVDLVAASLGLSGECFGH